MVIAFILILINIIGFIMMKHDKMKAKQGKWRTPEKNFWYIAVLGGALGLWFGMKTFRHKTKHRTFQFGIPFFFVINVLTWLTVYQYLM